MSILDTWKSLIYINEVFYDSVFWKIIYKYQIQLREFKGALYFLKGQLSQIGRYSRSVIDMGVHSDYNEHLRCLTV